MGEKKELILSILLSITTYFHVAFVSFICATCIASLILLYRLHFRLLNLLYCIHVMLGSLIQVFCHRGHCRESLGSFQCLVGSTVSVMCIFICVYNKKGQLPAPFLKLPLVESSVCCSLRQLNPCEWCLFCLHFYVIIYSLRFSHHKHFSLVMYFNISVVPNSSIIAFGIYNKL